MIPILLTAVFYKILATVSLFYAQEGTLSSLIWPPSALGLIAVFMLGWRAGFGIFIGAASANLVAISGTPAAENAHWMALVIGIGNALEAVFAGWFLQEVGSFCRNWGHQLVCYLLASIGGACVSANVGSMTQVIGGLLTPIELTFTWVCWFAGDLGGLLLLAPIGLAKFWWWPNCPIPQQNQVLCKLMPES